MRTPSIIDAINRLRPNAQWTLAGDFTYACLEWKDENSTKPTEAEVVATITVVEAEYDRNEYQRLRAPEYPPIGDQLDALWKGGEHAQEMLAKVQAVKSKYPKPE
jgi:hypothetical protein